MFRLWSTKATYLRRLRVEGGDLLLLLLLAQLAIVVHLHALQHGDLTKVIGRVVWQSNASALDEGQQDAAHQSAAQHGGETWREEREMCSNLYKMVSHGTYHHVRQVHRQWLLRWWWNSRDPPCHGYRPGHNRWHWMCRPRWQSCRRSLRHVHAQRPDRLRVDAAHRWVHCDIPWWPEKWSHQQSPWQRRRHNPRQCERGRARVYIPP